MFWDLEQSEQENDVLEVCAEENRPGSGVRDNTEGTKLEVPTTQQPLSSLERSCIKNPSIYLESKRKMSLLEVIEQNLYPHLHTCDSERGLC